MSPDAADRHRPLAAVSARVPVLGHALGERARHGLAALRRRRTPTGAPTRGVAFAGTIWAGGDAEPAPGVLVVDRQGRITDLRYGPRPDLPQDLLVLGGDQHWIGPGLIDAHVRLGQLLGTGRDDTSPVPGLETGLIGLRDLGAPMRRASRWQTGHRLPAAGSAFVASCGPVLAAPTSARNGPRDGSVLSINSPARARDVVVHLAAEGVDLITVVLQTGGTGAPALAPDVARAIVEAAHSCGIPAVAEALTVDLVRRAVDAGVDELTRVPTERLTPELVELLVRRRVAVTSTLQNFFSAGAGRDAAANAVDLIDAGVRVLYGTGPARVPTRVAVDPRELDRLAAAGLGRLGALRAATEYAASAAGMRLRTGVLRVGEPAALVLLPASPLVEPGVWRTPGAVFVDGRLTVGPMTPHRRPVPELGADPDRGRTGAR